MFRLRWMGPKRYDIAGIKTFLRSKSYSGTIQFRGECRNLSNRQDIYLFRTTGWGASYLIGNHF